MIYVVDASVVINRLTWTPEDPTTVAAKVFLDQDDRFVAPATLMHEVLGALTGRRARRQFTTSEVEELAHAFALLAVEIQPFPLDYDMIPRLLELSTNLGMADATYVLLGEEMGAPVITQDDRMIKGASVVTGHEVRAP